MGHTFNVILFLPQACARHLDAMLQVASSIDASRTYHVKPSWMPCKKYICHWEPMLTQNSELRTCLFDPSKFIVYIDIIYEWHYPHNYNKYGSGRLPLRQKQNVTSVEATLRISRKPKCCFISKMYLKKQKHFSSIRH